MKLSLQICLLALCVVAAFAKYKTKDFTDKERWDATLQGIAHAEEYIQNMNKAGSQGASHRSPASLLNFFRRASAKSEAIGRARIKMEKAVKHAERILLEKKRLQTAKVASREEQAEVIAEELYHKPGSILDKKELAHIYGTTDCEELQPEPICSNIPFYHSLRTITGVCNNLQHPTQGAVFTPFQRIIQAQYANGINSLFNQADEPDLGAFLPPSPSARLISDTAITDRVINDNLLTHLTMQWGQFMDHDLDLAVEFSDIECDLINCVQDEICAPVRVPSDDQTFGDGTTNNGACHNFQRTVPACVENPFDFNPREQVNELTHYIDGSMVYGSTNSRAAFLRGEDGLLRVTPDPDLGDLLPNQPQCAPEESPLGEVEEGSFDPEDCCPDGFTECGVAGDGRALEHVSLTVMHTIWVREHNRIATALRGINPQWDSDRVYVETREIVIAQIQQITFNEYLPALMGQGLGPYPGYNPLVDASVPNVFATAAYRFGHSQIQPDFQRLQANGQSVPAGSLNLVDSFFNPDEFVNGGGVPPIVRGWIRQPARTVDEFLNSVLTNQLFEEEPGDGMDLVTLNIQRGRDHGLPRYGVWKRFCADTLKLESDFRNELTAIRLRKLYGTDENIDLFVGALAEEPILGSVLGAVLTCIFTITFSRLREGDRFWYENPDPSLDIFTAEQLAEIKQTSFSRVLCDNGGIELIQPNPFFQDPDDIETQSCAVVPGINFAPWAEESFCFYRGLVVAEATTLVGLMNRPTGSGGQMLTNFPLSNEDGSHCVPFLCPSAAVPSRDIIGLVPRNRRSFCQPEPQGDRPGRTFITTVTQQRLQNDPLLFDSEDACNASPEVFLTIRCDGLVESKNRITSRITSKIASTAELENELARALQNDNTGSGTGNNMPLPTKLENTDLSAGIYDPEDIKNLGLNSTTSANTSSRRMETTKVAANTNTAGKVEKSDKLIDLLQATLQELKHNGK